MVSLGNPSFFNLKQGIITHDVISNPDNRNYHFKLQECPNVRTKRTLTVQGCTSFTECRASDGFISKINAYSVKQEIYLLSNRAVEALVVLKSHKIDIYFT